MQVPAELKYTRSDEWIRLDGDVATIGITDYAQHELGELVYVELPEVGQKLQPEVAFGVVESVKAVAELIAPLAGEVVEINEALPDDPSQVNNSPFEAGWMVKVKVEDASALDSLLSADEYAEYRK
jgi:glycine cleavage system H protein